MRKLMLATALFSVALAPTATQAGTQYYGSPGDYTFTIPQYVGTIQVEVWGAGGGGGLGGWGRWPGTAGGDSSFNGWLVGGGGGGAYGLYEASEFKQWFWEGGSRSGGYAGGAWGGSTNTWGSNGQDAFFYTGGNGGWSPAGGSGGSGAYTNDWSPNSAQYGYAPGGGGGGGISRHHHCEGSDTAWYDHHYASGGGGGGGYASKSYATSQLAPGASVSIHVGSGGWANSGTWNTEGGSGCGNNQAYDWWLYTGAGQGAPGAVKITWTSPSAVPPTKPTISANGQCKTGVPHSYTITSVSANPFAMVRYGIDWAGGTTPTQWVPSASTYVLQGKPQVVTHTWATDGLHTFQVQAVDSDGLKSPWASITVNCTSDDQVCTNICPTGYIVQNGQCVFNQCPPGGC